MSSRSLAEQGAYVQFDVIDKENYLLDETRAELVAALVSRGHIERLLLSHDRNRDYEMRYSGHTGYCHIFEDFLPRLRRLGVSEDQIEVMMVANPARVLGFPSPPAPLPHASASLQRGRGE